MMTTEEQIIAVAGFCGFREIKRSGPMNVLIGYMPEVWAPIPHYATDLNAIHKVALALTPQQQKTYWTLLRFEVDATAPQRLEALCRTLWPERWKE